MANGEVTQMNRENTENFGQYLYSIRSSQMTLREFAARVDKSPGYMCDLENNRKDPPNKELLDAIVEILSLDDTERIKLFDLAGKGRQEVSADLPDYIMNSEVGDSVRLALRTAKNNNASVEDWLKFVDEMLEKKDRRR
jgi:transcriptional regulator with XRE-family HTH domain